MAVFVPRLLRVIANADHLIPAAEHFDVEGFPENNGILDIQKGLHQLGGDLKTYREFLNDFIQELPGRINTLERSLEEKNMASLALEAHNLKGVSSNLGALQLSDYASKLDKQSNEGYTDQTQTLIMDVKRAGFALQKLATDFLEKKEIVASA
jgi:HPt (histidine-containing phosphotransfer) domain-containing protein